MKPGELDKILDAVKEGAAKQVEISVNGKIEKLLKSHQELKDSFLVHMEEDKVTSMKIDNYIQADNEYKDRKKIEDDEWRGKADEKLEMMTNIKGFSKVFGYILASIISIGGAIGAIIGIIRLIK